MLDRKSLPLLVVFVMIGLCLGMSVASGDVVVVGLNHWSRNKTEGFLFPTNTSDDINASGNELLDANLSGYAGDDLSWDAVDMEFDVTGNGSSKWNRDGVLGRLYTKVNGDDVDVNGTILCDDLGCGNVISTAFLNSNFVGGIDMTGDPWYMSGADWEVAQDFILDGYVLSDLLPNPTLTYDLGSGANRWANLFVADVNAEDIEAYDIVSLGVISGDGGGLDNLNSSNITGLVNGLWSEYGNTISPVTDGRRVVVNSSVNCTGANISGDVTVDGLTQHYGNVTISGLTKNDQPHLMLRAQDTVGFNNYKQSEIRFFDNNDVVIGNIWYNKDLLTTTKGINIVSSADILLDANGGAGNIVLNGLTWWKDDIKILLGKDNLGIGARFEFYANNNNGYLNPLNWGLGGTSHPVSFIYNDNNEDTDFIVNSSQGESLVVDGSTGNINVTLGLDIPRVDTGFDMSSYDGNIAINGTDGKVGTKLFDDTWFWR